jgi:ABC-type antimicrobial peptide transport system permease subunit
MTLVIRTDTNPAGFAQILRDVVSAIDPELPISNINTGSHLLDNSLAARRFSITLLAIFAGIAVLLACIGIYGVLSYLVTQRTREIGVRMALGARTRDVLAMVIRQGMTPAILGIVSGILVSTVVSRLIQSQLFGTSALDPLVYMTTPVLLAGVALFACLLPARKAIRTDPTTALRQE